MSQNKFLRNFIPFAVLVFGSYIGLTQFRKLNYKFRKNDNLNVFQEQLTRVGMDKDDYQAKKTPSLHDEYEKVMEKIDLDKWKNIRAPRPGENSREVQNEIRKKDSPDSSSTKK